MNLINEEIMALKYLQKKRHEKQINRETNIMLWTVIAITVVSFLLGFWMGGN